MIELCRDRIIAIWRPFSSVFARARENARKASCLSNSKQLGMALLQYAQDYDESAVPYTTGPSTGYEISWTELLMPYIKNSQVLMCPSRRHQVTGNGVMFLHISNVPPALAKVQAPADVAAILRPPGARPDYTTGSWPTATSALRRASAWNANNGIPTPGRIWRASTSPSSMAVPSGCAAIR